MGSSRGVGGSAGANRAPFDGEGSGGNISVSTGLGGTGGSAGSGPVRGGPVAAGGAAVQPAGGTSSLPPSDAPELPAGVPDAGSSGPPPCVDCETVRFTGAVGTVELGTPGGSLYMDICPRDQVVVGADYKFDFGNPVDFGFLTSVALVCGELVPNRRAGTLDVVVNEPLAPRGAGSGASASGGRCPLGQVVTAFEGARNFDGTTSELRELTLHCAPLVLGADGAVAIGTSQPAPPLSADFAASSVLPTDVLGLQPCPDGQVVRGAAVHAGNWVDGISFICSAPVLSQPDGQPCSSAIECQSGRCDGICQPRPCTPPAGCRCELLEDTQYAFCEAAQTQADASAQCNAAGMLLAVAQDPIAHGWLRSSAGKDGVQAAFWLGADDLLSEGLWQWAAGAGAVDLASELWEQNEARGGAAENCMAMTRNGHWDDVDCALTLPFACEASTF